MSDAPATDRGTGRVPRVRLDARELELARLPDGSIVAKRGVREVLLRDPEAGALLEELAEMLDGTRSTEAILDAIAPERRQQAISVLTLLLERRLLPEADSADTAEARFWSTFGAHGAEGPERLRNARVTVLGGDQIARGLVAQLLASGVGAIDVALVPGLIAGDGADEWLRGLVRDGEVDGRVRRIDAADALGSIAESALLCATSDAGLTGAMREANQQALAAGVPFLPAWVAELVGYVGPLTEPFDTACLHCYQLRAESNSGRRAESDRALRELRERNPTLRDVSGLLPPMAVAVSAVAAMEAVKRISRIAPADTAGRLIEINLISFASQVRRVLKLPRCPDCSDVMRQPAVALARGPQVPGRG